MISITLIILIILVILVFSLPQFGQAPDREDKIRISKSKNFNGKIFQNIGGVNLKMTTSKARDLFRQKKKNKHVLAPIKASQIQFRKRKDFEDTPKTTTKVTWLGHSSFLIEIDGYKLLIDPMFEKAAAPFSFMINRFNPVPLSINELPNIDVVLFSHDHFDHLNHRTVKALKNKVDKFITPLGVGSHLKKWGIDKANIQEADWWDTIHYKELTFNCTPAQHFSGRTFKTKASTLWCSWVINGSNANLFFSGDSGYFEGFKEIGNKYGPFDLCMMECGQYNTLWPEIHMTPEETVKAHVDLKGKLLLPIHWGTFVLSSHSWTDPVIRVLAEGKKLDVLISTPKIGESVTIGAKFPTSEWWKD